MKSRFFDMKSTLYSNFPYLPLNVGVYETRITKNGGWTLYRGSGALCKQPYAKVFKHRFWILDSKIYGSSNNFWRAFWYPLYSATATSDITATVIHELSRLMNFALSALVQDVFSAYRCENILWKLRLNNTHNQLWILYSKNLWSQLQFWRAFWYPLYSGTATSDITATY